MSASHAISLLIETGNALAAFKPEPRGGAHQLDLFLRGLTIEGGALADGIRALVDYLTYDIGLSERALEPLREIADDLARLPEHAWETQAALRRAHAELYEAMERKGPDPNFFAA